MSKSVFNWISTEQPLLRSVGPDSQHKADRNAVQNSCPKLPVRKMSSENVSFSPRGQHPCFGRISLLVVHEQAYQDVEHWEWYPSTLLYFSSCKNFVRPLHLVCYPGSSVRLA